MLTFTQSSLPINKIRLSVSGRLCLFGEHSDWAAHHRRHPGYCLVIGTDQCIRATVEPCDRFEVDTVLVDAFGRTNGEHLQAVYPWCDATLLSAARDGSNFFRYCAGVAYEMMAQYPLSKGIRVNVFDMNLPLKKGVSSSAAICVLVAKAFNTVFELGLSRQELMELAYRGERLTGSQCGRMDQACIYKKKPVLLRFNNADDIKIAPLSCAEDIHMFFVDLGGQKDTVKILKELQENYLKSPDMQKALGQENKKIMGLAIKALRAGDGGTLGLLMRQAQSVFDCFVAPCCPEQLTSPLLHTILEYKPLQGYIYGGKGVGSQGDGTAQFIARDAACREAAMALIESTFPQMRCLPLTLLGKNRVTATMTDENRRLLRV